MPEREKIRVEIKCPYCPMVWSESCENKDPDFGSMRVALKSRAGEHLMSMHPDRIFEIAEVMCGPFQEYVTARIDGTRREGQALTALQRVSNPLRLNRG